MNKTTTSFLVTLNIILILLSTYVLIQNHRLEDIITFKEINAERINIKNDDGTTVIAIANKQRLGEPIVEGKIYENSMLEREHFAGMIFYNELGDEMGGLIFNGFELPDGRKTALGHLSFDRFRDNQTINLEHKENVNGDVISGITFYDRPGNGNMKRSFDIIEKLKTQELTEEEKAKALDDWNVLKNSKEGLGKKRVFLGNFNKEPQLVLKDKKGKNRVKIFVDSLDVAKIQFLDSNGSILNEISGNVVKKQ